MRPISGSFAAAIRRSHERVASVAILDSLLNPIAGAEFTGEAGYAISGTVTMSRLRTVRRTCQLALANPDGVWTPTDAGSLFYWDRLIRLRRGVRLSASQSELVSLGVFIIDSPEVEVAAAGALLTIAGADQMDRLLRSRFTTPTTYSAGATLGSVISDLATDAGANSNQLSLDDGGKTLAANRTFEVGEERIKAVTDLCRAYALELYADADGILTLRPITDPNLAPVAWTFTAGEEATMLGVTKRWTKDRLYNHTLVTGERTGAAPVYAEASDDNPSSPTYINGPFGDRLYTYTSAMITTVGQAQAVADHLLYEHALIEEEIRLPHVANPALEIGDAIEIVEPVSGTSDRYIIDELVVPLGAGEAQLVVRKLRSLL